MGTAVQLVISNYILGLIWGNDSGLDLLIPIVKMKKVVVAYQKAKYLEVPEMKLVYNKCRYHENPVIKVKKQITKKILKCKENIKKRSNRNFRKTKIVT